MSEKKLEILYRDEHIVAINKPNGLLVHRSYIAAEEKVFAMQLLRDQIDQRVFTVHRLDRKTSGVLIFALNAETAALLQKNFVSQSIDKRYLAIVRGFFPGDMVLDYALTNDRGKKQNALTSFKLLEQTEIPLPFGKHQTSRYSLVEAYPKTGRQHQIRKHCAHLNHPIIGDRPHGCNKQNKLFKEQWGMTTMLLHASFMKLQHPVTNESLELNAPINHEFSRVLGYLDFKSDL
jgi:tRNA pseudouridine65 synthase